MVHLPLQYFQLPLDSRANLRLRRHRAYSGPVYRTSSKGTPGRRDEVSWSIVFAWSHLWQLLDAQRSNHGRNGSAMQDENNIESAEQLDLITVARIAENTYACGMALLRL
jgi:hypothetical protein